MLFLNQVKREFPLASWKKGQTLFRNGLLRKVRMDGSEVTGRYIGDPGRGDPSCHVALTMARGTISNSECSCEKHTVAEKHCSHVAALCVYVIERGSLLRAGIAEAGEEPDEENKEAQVSHQVIEKPAVTPAEAIALARGLFQSGKLTALSIEPAIRFGNKVRPTSRLIKVDDQGHWKTPDDGELLKVFGQEIPILQKLDAATVVYQGPSALEGLARLLESPQKSQVALHENLNVQLDREPLRLVSMQVGRKSGKSRQLIYRFRNSRISLTSPELAHLGAQGRLSTHYVWHEDRLLRFDPPLTTLTQYANRSGVAAVEGVQAALANEGFGYLYDDPEQPLHPLAAYRLSLELGVEDFQVDSEWTEFHEWRKAFEREKIPALPRVNYGFDLRGYQKNGLRWQWSLYHRGLSALLGDDMGLGKTHQVLAFLTTLYRSKPHRPRHATLVVAPTSVVAAWVQKLKKYDTGLNWYVFHGQGRTLPPKEVDLILTTYGLLQREPALRHRQWHTVILDEAQAVKNASTISSRAARVLKSEFRIAMTGTPVENHSTDLWSIMEFLLPGYLGSLPRFKRLYGSGRELPSAEKAQALRRLVAPFLLRRTKTQVLKELPEKTEEIVHCQMTAAQRRAYRAHLQSAEAAKVRQNLEEGKKIDYANILALLTRLKQVCDHPRLPEISSGKLKSLKTVDPLDSGKWETVEELITEAIGSDLKVVIFTQYLGMMDLIGRYLKERGIGFTDLRGDTADRSGRLEKFANDPDCRVFVCSLLAGGLGIDLTAASVCIHLDRWWNPAKENQATDRLHRIGQTRGVQVFKLQIPETVEDRIAEIITSKRILSDALIEESSTGLKSFSREELLELFRVVE